MEGFTITFANIVAKLVDGIPDATYHFTSDLSGQVNFDVFLHRESSVKVLQEIAGRPYCDDGELGQDGHVVKFCVSTPEARFFMLYYTYSGLIHVIKRPKWFVGRVENLRRLGGRGFGVGNKCYVRYAGDSSWTVFSGVSQIYTLTTFGMKGTVKTIRKGSKPQHLSGQELHRVEAKYKLVLLGYQG